MTALRRRRFRSSLEYTLLAAPALIYLLLFHYLPMGGVVMAFKNYKFNRGIFRSPWVGFRNFDYLFTSHDFTLLMRNTIGYSVAFVVTTTVFGVLTALLLNEISSRSAVKYYQTTMFLPRFLSWVIVGFFTWLLLNPVIGVFNKVLATAGLEPVSWYTERRYWPFILISVNLWKWVGVNMLFYYAALTGIDRGLYEAADMDGAGRLRKLTSISVPHLTPLITILTILALGSLIKGDFGLFWQIPRQVGYLFPVTDVIETYVFRGVVSGDMNIAAAVGLFQSAVGFFLIVAANLVVKRIAPDKALS